MRSLLVPTVVTALLAAAIVADSQTVTVSSPTQSSNGQVVTVTVTGEAAGAPIAYRYPQGLSVIGHLMRLSWLPVRRTTCGGSRHPFACMHPLKLSTILLYTCWAIAQVHFP